MKIREIWPLRAVRRLGERESPRHDPIKGSERPPEDEANKPGRAPRLASAPDRELTSLVAVRRAPGVDPVPVIRSARRRRRSDPTRSLRLAGMRWPSLLRLAGALCSTMLRRARPVPLPLRGPPCAAVARCLCRRSDACAALCSWSPSGARGPYCSRRVGRPAPPVFCALLAARASPCALLCGLRRFGRVGGVGRSFVAVRFPSLPHAPRALPPLSPSCSSCGRTPMRTI